MIRRYEPDPFYTWRAEQPLKAFGQGRAMAGLNAADAAWRLRVADGLEAGTTYIVGRNGERLGSPAVLDFSRKGLDPRTHVRRLRVRTQ